MSKPKEFKCKYCPETVKWNGIYFDKKQKGESLGGITPTINLDGTPHDCQKKTTNTTQEDIPRDSSADGDDILSVLKQIRDEFRRFNERMEKQ